MNDPYHIFIWLLHTIELRDSVTLYSKRFWFVLPSQNYLLLLDNYCYILIVLVW